MALHQLLFLALCTITCGYAAIRGGAPERIASAAIMAAIVATWISSNPSLPSIEVYRSIEIGIALTDVVLFAILSGVAMVSTRFWPMLMASMQGCGMLGHLVKPLGPDIIPAAYYATVALWGYPIVVVLAVATWRHQMRLARYGIDYAWVHTLPRRYRDGWSINELARPLPRMTPSSAFVGEK